MLASVSLCRLYGLVTGYSLLMPYILPVKVRIGALALPRPRWWQIRRMPQRCLLPYRLILLGLQHNQLPILLTVTVYLPTS